MRPKNECILCFKGLKIQNEEPFNYFEQKVYIFKYIFDKLVGLKTFDLKYFI